MGTGHIVLGGIQMTGHPNHQCHNYDTGDRLFRRTAKAGAQVVMTPEVILSGFFGGLEDRKMAESIPAPRVLCWQTWQVN